MIVRKAGFVIKCGDYVLMIKGTPVEIDGIMVSKYGFPKGNMRDGEDTYQCACRELEEETHLRIDAIGGRISEKEFVVERPGYRGRPGEKHHYFLAEVKAMPPIVADPAEIAGYYWFKIGDIQEDMTVVAQDMMICLKRHCSVA